MAEEKKIEVVEEISQAEGIEKRVAEAVRAAREAWQADMERQIDRAREEAEALARMSGEERMAHELSQRAAELDAREREISRRELRAEAMRLLDERGLPRELADVLDCGSAEELTASLDVLERAFRAAVQQGIEARMRGDAPAAGNSAPQGKMSDEDYYRDRIAARQ